MPWKHAASHVTASAAVARGPENSHVNVHLGLQKLEESIVVQHPFRVYMYYCVRFGCTHGHAHAAIGGNCLNPSRHTYRGSETRPPSDCRRPSWGTVMSASTSAHAWRPADGACPLESDSEL